MALLIPQRAPQGGNSYYPDTQLLLTSLGMDLFLLDAVVFVWFCDVLISYFCETTKGGAETSKPIHKSVPGVGPQMGV